ncbi:ATP-binding protein [Paracoccus sp. (in: a-proteobacteria)]|uniref:hybrid sensor histidine kinase/response regulator n=1 Tax=Paracoccus sp. TaxID=267 RepID=UPI003A88AC2A
MSAGQARATRRSIWNRTSIVVLLIAFCISTAAGMGWLVMGEIDDLSVANSDNQQWSLAQTEVEFLRFQVEVIKARADPSNLPALRKNYDVFYSRIATLDQGGAFKDVRDDPATTAPRRKIRAFLDQTSPLMDGDDQSLVAAVPGLVHQVTALGPSVREISLAGVARFVVVSDTRRADVMRTLDRIAIVLILLMGGLSLLTVAFQRLYRTSEAQSKELRLAGGRMRTIVETSADAIIVTDSTGRILDLNEGAVRLFDYSRAEAVGRVALDLYYPRDVATAIRSGSLGNIFANMQPPDGHRHFEAVAINRRGLRFPVEISHDSADGEGETVCVAFIRDISQRKAAEQGLTIARDRALAGEKAKAEFLAVMSHEMRTPLNGLLGTMQLMREHDLSVKQTELLDRMQNSGALLLGLVNDVLDLSKFEAGKLSPDLRPFDVATLLDGIVETTSSLAAQNGNILEWLWVGPALNTVQGDSRRLRQVLLNLVGNAVKFTHGGEITIEVEVVNKAVHMVEFRVIDTGIGIAPENIERIFKDFETLDPSYSRQAGGTGLGLGISRRLIGLIGGEIGVESEPGEGSLFWIRLGLPPAEPSQIVKVRDKAAGRPTTRPLSILLVEDNEINRFVAREMLEADGHRVTEAVNGRAGVEWATAQEFDAILMDISMPVMDGQAAARAIRGGKGASARAPIVAVTAHALPEEVEQFRAAGMKYYISKPIDREVLSDTLYAISSGDAEAATRLKRACLDSSTEKLVDRGQLAALRQALRPGDAEMLLDRFLGETDTIIAELSASKADATDLAAVAHKCAGSCATFGLTALRDALHRIESRAQSREVTTGELVALGPLWQRSRAVLLERGDG